MKTQWKFLKEGMRSYNGDIVWKIGEWQEPLEPIMCKQGYHSSNKIYKAYSWINGSVLAKVECRGKHIDDTMKSVWENQRVIKSWKWTEKNKIEFLLKMGEIYLEENPEDDDIKNIIELIKSSRIALSGGVWYAGAAAGLFFWSLCGASSSSSRSLGSRECVKLEKWLMEYLNELEEIHE